MNMFCMFQVTSQIPKMASVKYMSLMDEMIQDNRTTRETVYLKNATRLHDSTMKMKQQLNNTVAISVETLKNIASVIDTAVEYVKEIAPNQERPVEEYVKKKRDIVESGNDTICSVFQPYYVGAEKLSRNASRLLKIIEINSNQARTINLEFCLTEPTKPLRISCLQNIMKTYTRHLTRVRNALKSYTEFDKSIQRGIDNATRTTVIRPFQRAHGSARTVVKYVFEAAEITPDVVTQHTQDKLAHYSKTIQSYFLRANGKLKSVKAVYENFNLEHENYRMIFDNLKNLALLAADIIVNSKNVTASELDYVKGGLSKRSGEHFHALVDYYNALRQNSEFIGKQISSIEEKFLQSKPVNISCADSTTDIAYIFDCLNEKILYYRQILNTTRNFYNISNGVAENIIENADIFNRKVYDQFTLEVYNLTLGLIKEYDLDAADIISYEQTIVQKKYNATLSAMNMDSEKYNDKFLEELDTKITLLNTINEIINEVVDLCQDSDNENMAKARESLTELNETLAKQYDTGSVNVITKIGNITEYSADNKINNIAATMDEVRLSEKCSISNNSDLNVVKVAHILQCVEREQTTFNNGMNAIVSDYVTLTSELEQNYALYVHDIQATLRKGIKKVLPLVRHKRRVHNVLTCLNSVDIRKANSSRLESDLNRCSSIISE